MYFYTLFHYLDAMKNKTAVWICSIAYLFLFQLPACKKNVLKLPVLNTSVSEISIYSARFSSRIASDAGKEITAKGFCYGLSPNPTLSNTVVAGIGIDSMYAIVSGLTAATTYYVRSYATNSDGTGYGEQEEFSTEPPLTIGQYYKGGVIGYIDQTGLHGLIRTSSPFGPCTWGCVGTNVSGTVNSFGGGPSNTTAIFNSCNSTELTAAQICTNYISEGGYTDWFLPSIEELNLICSAMSPNDRDNKFYWSSSQSDATTAIMKGFEFCTAGPVTQSKDSMEWIWPVRIF